MHCGRTVVCALGRKANFTEFFSLNIVSCAHLSAVLEEHLADLRVDIFLHLGKLLKPKESKRNGKS